MNKALKMGLGVMIGFVMLVTYSELFTDKNNDICNVNSNANYEFIKGPSMFITGYNSSVISGTIINNTNTDKEYVEITFILYDKDGNIIGTALDNTNNLKSNDIWNFEANIIEDNVSSFELKEVSGFN